MPVVDLLVGSKINSYENLGNWDYLPTHAVESVTLNNLYAPNLAVLFQPVFGGQYFFRHLSNRLQKSGNASVSFGFNPNILSANRQCVVDSFGFIRKIVARTLQELSASNRYDKIMLYGSDIGNIALTSSIEEIPDFSGAVMINPASNLADCVWEGQCTQSIRLGLNRQKVTLDKLRSDWRSLAISAHAEAFRDKPVFVVQSMTDEIVPTPLQSAAVEDLWNSNAVLGLIESRLGHYLTLANYCLQGARDVA